MTVQPAPSNRNDAMNRLLFVLVPLLGPPSWAAARASHLDCFTPRELVASADAVVQVELLDPANIQRFRVVEVLFGAGLKPGDALMPRGMEEYVLRIRDGIAARVRPCCPIAGLLFLKQEGRGWRPILAGLRLLERDGKVIAPVSWAAVDPYEMMVRPNLRWDDLLRQVRADCAAVQRLMDARARPRRTQRNQALLSWVYEHSREFGTTSGWGPLEEKIFDWIHAGGDVEQSWAAVRLYAELHAGQLAPLRIPVFGTPAGRRFLLCRAEAGILEGDRVRALMLLALPQTLRPAAGQRGIMPVDDKERADLVARLAPLLQAKDASVRGAAARALQASVLAPGEKPGPIVVGALSALEQAYHVESPGPTRDELAQAIHALCSSQRWQQLSGNPHALFACLKDLEREHGKLTFWIDLQSDGVSIHEAPVLRLERLQGDRVAERQQMRLEFANAPAQGPEGWTGPQRLLVQSLLRDLKPGTWRVTVCGTAGKGKDRVSWVSEPRVFTVEASRNGASDFAVPTLWETRLGR